jgi:hypothetical protein
MKVGDRVRVKQPLGNYHAGVLERKVEHDPALAHLLPPMWWVRYDGSRADYCPNPIAHHEYDIEPLQ